MRAFAEAWPDAEFVQAVLAQLSSYHQPALLDKLTLPEDRRWYAARTIEHNWSRNILVMQIETGLLQCSGSAITNFDASLPQVPSDLAREFLKDPYHFYVLGLTEEAQEREVENGLLKHVTEFLLELGAGFAFVGRQVLLDAGGDEFSMSEKVNALIEKHHDEWELLAEKLTDLRKEAIAVRQQGEGGMSKELTTFYQHIARLGFACGAGLDL